VRRLITFVVLFLWSCGASVQLEWEPVTTNTAGELISVDYYNVYHSYMDTLGVYETTEFSHQLMLPPGYHAFEVSAVKDGWEGDKSAKAAIFIDPLR